MRRLGLEWLYRLGPPARRWRRIMTAVPLFLWTALRERHGHSREDTTTQDHAECQ